jgi:diguanylate cyclase (GGDEF)-like protein
MLTLLVGILAQGAGALLRPGAAAEISRWRIKSGDSAVWALPTYDDRSWRVARTPASWMEEGLSGYRGYAWYRWTYEVGELPPQPLGIRFRSVATAFEAFVDGQPMGGVGDFPPRYRARSVVPVVFALPISAMAPGRHVVAVRVYSAEPVGGLVGSVRIGSLEGLRAEQTRRDLALLATALLLLGIGLHQVFFWIRRLQALEHLFIFLYCFTLSLFFVTWMPSVRLAVEPVVFWYRLYLALATLATGFFCQAFRRIFELEEDRVVRWASVYFFALVPLALLAPTWAQVRAVAVWLLNPALLIIAATVLVLAIGQLRQGARHARILLWGTLILAAALFHDILVDWGLLALRPAFPWLILVGCVCFVASLAMTTAQKFVDTETAALYDRLTGLYRREVVMDALGREIRRAARTRQPLGVLMLDLDRFKQINDTLGHQAGDRALAEVGRRLAEAGRAVDWLGRYGGEEFLGVLAATDESGSRQAAERLRRAVAALPIALGRTTRTITLSGGVAAYDGGDSWPTAEQLVGGADAALYRAKAAGRNCVST